VDGSVLAPADGDVLGWAGVALLCAAIVAGLFPRAVLVPVIVVEVWFGATLVAQAFRIRRSRARSVSQDRGTAGAATRDDDGGAGR
jgi:hypothetical protein